MNDNLLLNELINKATFKFDQEMTPAYNYLLFQQSISFEQGVEFLSSSQDSPQPVFYLLQVPGLSIDLVKAEAQLQEFHNNITSQLQHLLQTESDLYRLFSFFYELDRTVQEQQSEYHFGREQYFGSVSIFDYPVKELKNLELPVVRSKYRGTFLNAGFRDRHPVNYHELGTEIKNHLSQLYMLKRRYNMKLIHYLKDLRDLFFDRKRIGDRYRYTGDTSDLVEFALVLHQTGRIENLTAEKVEANDFCRDLCTLLGKPYTKLSNYLPTINSRLLKRNSFSVQTPKLLNDCLNKLN